MRVYIKMELADHIENKKRNNTDYRKPEDYQL